MANISNSEIQDGRSLRISDTNMSDSDDSDDEFFEAQEELSQKLSADKLTVDSNSVDIEISTAEGVLEETDMKLLRTGQTLCIPMTQVKKMPRHPENEAD